MDWSAFYAGLTEFSRSAGFGGIAALLAALIAYKAATKTAEQKEVADKAQSALSKRAQWWVRAQWAADKALNSDDNIAQSGLAALSALAESKDAGVDELRMLQAVTDSVIAGDHGRGQVNDSG